jgi:hypothetical protein
MKTKTMKTKTMKTKTMKTKNMKIIFGRVFRMSCVCWS